MVVDKEQNSYEHFHFGERKKIAMNLFHHLGGNVYLLYFSSHKFIVFNEFVTVEI